jgi:hypothetical protein
MSINNTKKHTNKYTKKISQSQRKSPLDDLRNIFNKSNTKNEAIDLIVKFHDNNLNNKKFDNYNKKVELFSKDVLGKSGASVGILNTNKNMVIKTYYYNTSDKKLYVPSTSPNCIVINNYFNEIVINLVIKNLKYLVKLNVHEIASIKKHTNEMHDYCISDNGSSIIAPLIGFNLSKFGHQYDQLVGNPLETTFAKLDQIMKLAHTDKIAPEVFTSNFKYVRYITNFRELLVINHLPVLEKLMKSKNNDDHDIILLYDKFMSTVVDSYLNTIKILQKHINYINTDTKLTNTFVKYHKCKCPEFQILKENGFIIDFVLILSDLEKSTFELNGHKIITYPRSPAKVALLSFIGQGLLHNVRYSCTPKFDKLCPQLSIYDFDILLFVIDLYAFYLRAAPNMLDYLESTSRTIINILDSTPRKFAILKEILVKNKYKINKHYASILNYIITKYCKALN